MELAEEQAAKAFLRRCAAAYDALVAHVLRFEARGNDEQALRWLGIAATAAWQHPGRFADERLEAAALRIGERLQPLGETERSSGPSSPPPEKPRRRVLHVATVVYETGGHTRLIENWVHKDPDTVHSLILLDQQQHRVRSELTGRIAASGGEVLVLPSHRPLLERARRLRRAAQAGHDCVILHHHPNDPIPLAALATSDCPPVGLMNHADHAFWLGTSVADAVLNFRPFAARLSRERRGARASLMLPLPMDLKPRSLDRQQARTLLGIGAEEVMLLTMGSANKYRPTKAHDFFRTLAQVLNDNPKARLFAVGIGADDLRSFGATAHERMELLGPLQDPSLYQAAADLFVEGFPLNSYTALFETAAYGVCPVLMHAPTPQVDLSGEPALSGLVSAAKDEAGYLALLTVLINDPRRRARIGQEVARRAASISGADYGRAYLHPVYEELARIGHRPAPPPAQPPAEHQEDLDLAVFHRSQTKAAVLARGASDALASLTPGDLLRLIAISIRIGDTRPNLAHAGAWLRLVARKAFL
jgi:hypothetical protein